MVVESNEGFFPSKILMERVVLKRGSEVGRCKYRRLPPFPPASMICIIVCHFSLAHVIIAVLPFGLLIIGWVPPPTCSILSYTFPRVSPLPQQLQPTIATQISRINFANHHGRHRSTKCDGCMPSHDVYFPTIWHAAVRSNGTSPGNWGMGDGWGWDPS